MGRYIEAAKAVGVCQDGEPPPDRLLAGPLQRNQPGPLPRRETPATAQIAGHEEQVARGLGEERLQLTRVQGLLAREGVAVSYTTLRRYVPEAGFWKRTPSTVRMADWPPGEVAEMDFGRLGSIVEAGAGKRQTVWALLVVLPYSRHSFVWPLFGQTLVETIAGPDALEPRPTRGFLEYS